ncbi:hypothetical protein EVG20_g9994, partial [Dentipellis fragilis]
MGLFDFLGALANCLCGPSSTQPQQGQQPEVYQLPPRPPVEQQQVQLQPQAQPAPYYPAPQLSFPVPQPEHPPQHAQKPHHKPHHQKPHRPHEQGAAGESYAHPGAASPPPSSPPRVSSPPAAAHAPVPPQFQRANGQVVRVFPLPYASFLSPTRLSSPLRVFPL